MFEFISHSLLFCVVATVFRVQHLLTEVIFFLGIKVKYDLSKPANERVVSLSMLCTECRVPKYEPLDPEKTYTVVMPSYLVDGGDGFGMIKKGLLKHNTGRKQGRSPGSGCETRFTVIVVSFVRYFFH